MHYRLSALAEQDLDEIWSYVAEHASPTIADPRGNRRRVRLRARAHRLAVPGLWRQRPDSRLGAHAVESPRRCSRLIDRHSADDQALNRKWRRSCRTGPTWFTATMRSLERSRLRWNTSALQESDRLPRRRLQPGRVSRRVSFRVARASHRRPRSGARRCERPCAFLSMSDCLAGSGEQALTLW